MAKIIYLAVNFVISSFLFSLTHVFGSQPFPMVRFLDGVQKCDIQLIRAGKGILDFSQNYYSPPTIGLGPNAKTYDELSNYWGSKWRPTNFSLNTLKVRVGRCKISLIFFVPLNHFTLATRASALYAEGLLSIPEGRSLRVLNGVAQSKNVTLIIHGAISHLTNSLWAVMKDITYYSGFAFQMTLSNGWFELCSLIKWRNSLLPGNLTCIRLAEKPLMQLHHVFGYSKCWFAPTSQEQLERAELRNPFNSSEEIIPTKFYAMKDVFHNANTTVCRFIDRRFRYPLFRQERGSDYPPAGRTEQYPLSLTGQRFLTCYTSQFLTFEFYLTPFQLELWIGVAITLVFVVGCLTIFIKLSGDCNGTDTASFSPWLHVLPTIFEETNSVPSVIEKKQFYRLTFGTWALMASILTNCYNGIMIETLIAPFPGIKILTFKDIFCEEGKVWESMSNMSAWLSETKILEYWSQATRIFGNSAAAYENRSVLPNHSLKNHFELDHCFRLLSAPQTVALPNLPSNQFFYTLKDWWWQIEHNIQYFESQLYPETLLLSPKHGHELNDGSEKNRSKSTEELSKLVEAEVVKCGRTVFIAEWEEVAQQYFYLSKKYYWKNFYISEDSLMQDIALLSFRNIDGSNVPTKFKAYVEAGIWSRLEEAGWARKFDRRRKSEREHGPGTQVAVPLDGSILTLFVLCGMVISIALLLFGKECRREIYLFSLTIVPKLGRYFILVSRKINNYVGLIWYDLFRPPF
ncbi:hypothetical protein Fcan01_26807 [Folsomia candida]|uniref:Uncharacterized protein n=1 Tax=Folsomia candida TaxID=158441 RepID=A0A226CYI6_FOLCA|nr:hypothetical protein Fcan01_26807 [Folsomia candida]